MFSSAAFQEKFICAMILASLAAICTALVAVTHRIAAPRIAANEQAYLEQSLAPVLAGLTYDGKLTESTMTIPVPHSLPGDAPVSVYRVFANEQPVAALFVSARDGFTGPIKLLVGVAASGELTGVLTGVRVLEHKETPALGDLIDSSRSDWILHFSGRSLGNPEASRWAIRGDGGDFDQLTGWIAQEGLEGADASVVRDELVRLEGIPLVCRAIGLPPGAPGDRVRVAFGEPDFWEVKLPCRYAGKTGGG